jgi:hypothetical protein
LLEYPSRRSRPSAHFARVPSAGICLSVAEASRSFRDEGSLGSLRFSVRLGCFRVRPFKARKFRCLRRRELYSVRLLYPICFALNTELVLREGVLSSFSEFEDQGRVGLGNFIVIKNQCPTCPRGSCVAIVRAESEAFPPSQNLVLRAGSVSVSRSGLPLQSRSRSFEVRVERAAFRSADG